VSVVETYLVEPSNRYKASFLKAIAEYRQIGELQYAEVYALAETDFDAFLRRLENASKGIQLPKGWVPVSTFWLVDPEETVVGVMRIRHSLTPSLEVDGGHIGYDVPPSQRGRGYGNRLLELGLERARALELNRVLLTCEPSNLRSRKIIERLGGQLQDQVISPESGLTLCRYWVDLK
jgi:predicted acetyltransferase